MSIPSADQNKVERCIQEIILGNSYWVCTYGFYSDASKKIHKVPAFHSYRSFLY